MTFGLACCEDIDRNLYFKTTLDLSRLFRKHALQHDSFLQLEDAVKKCLWRWRTTRYINIDRHKAIDTLDDTITVVDIP